LQLAIAFLSRYENDKNEVLDKIVTGDKIWVHYFQPESKRNSKEWKYTNSPRTKKASHCICRKGDVEAFF